jgi:hypothetical protein
MDAAQWSIDAVVGALLLRSLVFHRECGYLLSSIYISYRRFSIIYTKLMVITRRRTSRVKLWIHIQIVQ